MGALCLGFKGYMEQVHERLAISSPTVLCPTLYPKSPKSVLSEKASPGCGDHTAGCQSRDRRGSQSSELCWFTPDNPLEYRWTDSRSLRASRKYCSPGSPHTLPLPLHPALGQARCPSFPSQDSPYSSGHRYIHTRKVFSSTPAVQDFPCTLNPV